MPTRTAITRLATTAMLAALAMPAHAQPAPPEAPPELPTQVPAEPAPPADAPDAPGPGDQPAPEPTPDQQRDLWFDRLDDPDFAVRQDATDALLQDTGLTDEHLQRMFRATDNPETRRRLERIAEHQVLRVRARAIARELRGEDGPIDRAAVGFSYDAVTPEHNPHAPTAAVIVIATMPGFPGHAYLRTGDLVLAIDGQASRSASPLAIQRWLGDAIGWHQDGDDITLTVFRDGETLDLTLPCAGIKTLNEMYATSGVNGTVRGPSHQRHVEDALARLRALLPDAAHDHPLPPAE